MTIPYSNYSELSPQFASLYSTTPPLSEPELVQNALLLEHCSLQSIRPYPPPLKTCPSGLAYPMSCPLPGQDCVGSDLDAMSPLIWDSHPYVYPEHDAFLDGHGPLLQFSPDELAFSPHTYSSDHVSYPPHSYTRMFRGRKSKAASEVLDELRPYACDICQAAFARSHDRDRHKRSHTGETPYQCHGCGAGFKRPDARKRHWERDPLCAQEDWRRVQHTAEGAKRRARAKGRQLKPIKKSIRV